jgi:hypothetical protein
MKRSPWTEGLRVDNTAVWTALAASIVLVVFTGISALRRHSWLAVPVFASMMLVVLAYMTRRTLWRRARFFLDPSLVPTRLADVQPNGVVHTMGIIANEPRDAPMGGPPCVFHRVVVESIEPPKTLIEEMSASSFVLEDTAGGRLRVVCDGARWHVHTNEIMSSSELVDPLVAQFLAQRGIAHTHLVRALVEWIGNGDHVFVRGAIHDAAEHANDAYRSNERVDLEMRATPKDPLDISRAPIPRLLR